MRSLLSLLGLGSGTAEQTSAAETETVRKIMARLEALPRDQARYIAAFAYILGRVAHADLEISAEETQAMEMLVMRHGKLAPEQAVLVVEIAKSQNRLFGGTESFLVTRELGKLVGAPERQELLRCLFAVSAADGSISAEEEHQIRQIADELNIPRETYVAIRSEYSDQRSVIQGLIARDSATAGC